jgi:hypothetical protein
MPFYLFFYDGEYHCTNGEAAEWKDKIENGMRFFRCLDGVYSECTWDGNDLVWTELTCIEP